MVVACRGHEYGLARLALPLGSTDRRRLSHGHPCGEEPVLPAHDDAGAGVGDYGPVVEHPLRLLGPRLVRPRLVLRARRLYCRAVADKLWPDALDRHSDCGCRGRLGRLRHWLPDIPLARPLFRARHARLPVGPALRVRVAGLPGGVPADAARDADRLHAIQRQSRIFGPCPGPDDPGDASLAADRALTLRHVVARYQAERDCGRGCRHRYLPLENEGDRAVGPHRRCDRWLLCGGPAGGDAGLSLRHADLGPGAHRRAIWWRRLGLGPGDWFGYLDPARGGAAG